MIINKKTHYLHITRFHLVRFKTLYFPGDPQSLKYLPCKYEGLTSILWTHVKKEKSQAWWHSLFFSPGQWRQEGFGDSLVSWSVLFHKSGAKENPPQIIYCLLHVRACIHTYSTCACLHPHIYRTHEHPRLYFSWKLPSSQWLNMSCFLATLEIPLESGPGFPIRQGFPLFCWDLYGP